MRRRPRRSPTHHPVRLTPAVLLVAFALLVVSCGGNDGSGPTPTNDPALAPLVGTWQASSFVHTQVSDASSTADIIGQGGMFRVAIEASGRYTGTIQLATESRVETGTMRVVGGELVIQPVSPPAPEERVRFVVQGSAMTWTGNSEYDFNLDGIPQASTVRIEFVRN